MFAVTILALVAQTVPAPAPDQAGDDIVVRGRRRCDLSAAGKTVSGAALDARAAEWRAGRPVRIAVPAGIRTRCLAKVMFRLHDRGVTTATFVDAP